MRIIILTTILLLPIVSFGHTNFSGATMQSTPENKLWATAILGVNTSGFLYSDTEIKKFDSKVAIHLFWGLGVRYQLKKSIYFEPHFLFIKKGGKIEDGFTYELNSKNLDIRLPLTFDVAAIKANRLFLKAGPYVGFTRSGSIQYNDYNVELNKGNHKWVDLGIYAGLGIRREILNDVHLAFEAGYGLGLTDTYSKDEISGVSEPLNAMVYEINGKRKNKGFAFAFSLHIPISGFKDILKKKEIVVKDPVEKEKVTEDEEVTEKVEDKNEDIFEPEPKLKDCYTINEIEDFLGKNESIKGKKICTININFETNKSKITKNSHNYLNLIVMMLESNPDMNMTINGHTDDIGEDDYNLTLSEKRAEAVKKYIVSKGINENRIAIKGYGESMPVDSNKSENGRRNNRRVEFEIIRE